MSLKRQPASPRQAQTLTAAPPRQRPVPRLDRLPRPVYARVESLQHGTVTKSHSHPWIQLSYAIRGVLQIHTARGRFLAPPREAILVPPGVRHVVVSSPHTEMRSLYIAPEALHDVGVQCEVLTVSDLLRELIRHFSGLPVDYDDAGADGRLVRVMLDLIQAASRQGFSLPWPSDRGLAAICAAMARAPYLPMRLDDWSGSLGVSLRTLERLFQRETGLSMRQWRTRARLLHALPQLERGDRVTDVALACGYESTSSFIAAFRAFFGRTPGSLTAGVMPTPFNASRRRAVTR